DCEPLAARGLGKFRAKHAPRRIACSARLENLRRRTFLPRRQHTGEVAAGFTDVAHCNRPPLCLIGSEQSIAAPAVKARLELPSQVDRFLDASVHAKTTGRRQLMRSVAN